MHLVGMDGKEMMIQRFRGENPQWSWSTHTRCYGKSEAFETLGGGQRVCGGVLPVCEGEGDPGQRGSWQGGPLSSSHPPVPGSAVQTAPPAPWLTPAEPLHSHTAPYTLHSPERKEGHYTQPLGFLPKTCTHLPGQIRRLRHFLEERTTTAEERTGFARWMKFRLLKFN